jgi:hypothetical protein
MFSGHTAFKRAAQRREPALELSALHELCRARFPTLIYPRWMLRHLPGMCLSLCAKARVK